MAQCVLMKVHSVLAEPYSLFETLQIQRVVHYFASVLVKLKGTIYFCMVLELINISVHISTC
jgi:hypothetical protein